MAELSRPAPPPTRALPLRDGIGASSHWLPAGDWPSLLDYLDARFPAVTRAVWARRLAAGDVRAGDGRALAPDSAYAPDSRIHYYREVADEPVVPGEVDILYRDEHLLVADKPHFLPVAPVGRFLQETLMTRLRRLGGLDDLVPLHRLDRETAGLVLCSVNPASRAAYTALFRERRIHKVYEAVAATRPDLDFPRTHRSRLDTGEPFFRQREVAGEANSETRISVLRSDGERTLYQAEPVTGRTHQIRVHFLALGMPLLNDRLYPDLRDCAEDDFSAPLQLLARGLRFDDPITGAARGFTSRRRLLIPPDDPT